MGDHTKSDLQKNLIELACVLNCESLLDFRFQKRMGQFVGMTGMFYGNRDGKICRTEMLLLHQGICSTFCESCGCFTLFRFLCIVYFQDSA